MLGLAAGQSAFGDVYAWFKNLLIGPVEALVIQSKFLDTAAKKALLAEIEGNMIPWLTKEAEKIEIGATVLPNLIRNPLNNAGERHSELDSESPD